MSSVSISKIFLSLLAATFLLVVAFSIRFTFKFAGFSAEASQLAENLHDTSALSLELNNQLNSQINLVYQQFEHLDKDFPARFSAMNFSLANKQTRYLRLDIGSAERLTVESIKSLQSELGVEARQIYFQLQNGNRSGAVLRLQRMQNLQEKIDAELARLNALQTGKLRLVQQQLNESIRTTNRAILGLGAGLLLSLMVFTVLLRRRVLQPLAMILVATNKVRDGDFAARAQIDRRDELGQLARGFNFMAESLAESYASLESKVEERTRQLQEVQRQLIQAEKMSAVGRMLSGVAHELNNPLTVIMGHTELARRRLVASSANQKDITLMTMLYEQGDRCRKIVANLLQFARQEKPHLERVRLNDVVEQALQLREYEMTTRNIKLVREYDPTNPFFAADRNKIVQVVLNLINNAHDAIRDAGRPGTIRVCTFADQDTVRLEFLDNGTGLRDPERVFDPFYTTKEVGQGTGLGLSVCYGIVEEHNGSITADNREQGARFVIVLPVGPEDIFSDPRQEPASTPAVSKKKALVIDDEELLVNLQTSFLSDLGIAPHGVNSGTEAIAYLQQNKVDLVISDVRMPGAVDGIQLYEWVARNRPELTSRFLFVSGDMIGMNVGEFFLESTAARIQKPFAWDDYERTVRQLLGDSAI
ncbi:MAG TPA: ATP-binding protein [Pyrinomonadaceae bacterium]